MAYQVFNVDSRVLAAKCAAALGASKLIFIADGAHLEDSATGPLVFFLSSVEHFVSIVMIVWNAGLEANFHFMSVFRLQMS